MTNAMCAGEQDRNNTTSETHPYRPPPKTKNCYLNDPAKGFDRGNCGTSSDNACISNGRKFGECIPDDYGGYCKDTDSKIYVALASIFTPMSGDQLIDRYKSSNTGEVEREVSRALNEQKRKYNNKISELHKLGKFSNKENNTEENDNEVHGFASSLFIKIGMGLSFIMFLISLSIVLIRYKFI